MTRDRIVQTDEKLPLLQALPLAAQHLMAMFGATVLVPILTGLDPAVGLMTSGLGTILYLICVRNKIPSYLGLILRVHRARSSPLAAAPAARTSLPHWADWSSPASSTWS